MHNPKTRRSQPEQREKRKKNTVLSYFNNHLELHIIIMFLYRKNTGKY